jgi:hypothetical protein
MNAEVSRYLAIHATTATERARADARVKAATAKFTQQLKTHAHPGAICMYKDTLTTGFIDELTRANSTGASYLSTP